LDEELQIPVARHLDFFPRVFGRSNSLLQKAHQAAERSFPEFVGFSQGDEGIFSELPEETTGAGKRHGVSLSPRKLDRIVKEVYPKCSPDEPPQFCAARRPKPTARS